MYIYIFVFNNLQITFVSPLVYYHDITKILIKSNYTSLYFFPIAYFEKRWEPNCGFIIIIIVYYYFVKILIECVCVWGGGGGGCDVF